MKIITKSVFIEIKLCAKKVVVKFLMKIITKSVFTKNKNKFNLKFNFSNSKYLKFNFSNSKYLKYNYCSNNLKFSYCSNNLKYNYCSNNLSSKNKVKKVLKLLNNLKDTNIIVKSVIKFIQNYAKNTYINNNNRICITR